MTPNESSASRVSPKRTTRNSLLVLFLSFLLSSLAFADAYDPPVDYYTTASGLSGTALKSALHNIIDGHTKLSYTPGVWTALRAIDEDPNNSNNILCIYSNRSIPKADQDGSSSATYVWNREHSFPKSFGFNYSSWSPYTDVHHLFASEKNINSTRNNHRFGWATGGTQYDVINSSDVNKLLGDNWEPWNEVKGDMARAMFYMDTRYNGDTTNEPDLSLDNNTPVVGQPHMAMLDDLLEWHALDAVSTRERRRNQMIYTDFQHNRNPYVDHPEYACSIYGGAACGGATPTATPTPSPTATSTATASPTPAGGTLVSGTPVSDSVAQGAWDHYTIYVPSNGTQLQVVMSGNNDADMYIKRGSQPTSSVWDFRPYVGGSAETVTINSSSSPALVPSNTYYVSVYGYSATTSSYTLTATVTTSSATPSPTPSPTATATASPTPSATASPTPSATPSPTPSSGGLTSGVTINDSVANGQWDHFTISVPSNGTALQIVMTGNNDADLYVKRGSQPSSSSYDFRPYIGGSNETVTVNSSSSPALVPGNTYYISVYGYASATSTYALTATVTTGTAPTASPTPSPTPASGGDLTSGVTISESVAYHVWTHHTIFVPSGSGQLLVQMTGTGDGDMYVKKGSQPTSSVWDFRPYVNGSSETVTVNGSSSPSLVAGTMYYISVYGYAASSISLTATIN